MAYFPVRGLFCHVPPSLLYSVEETEDELNIWNIIVPGWTLHAA